MTNDEKRRLAIAAEVQKLRDLSVSFQHVVDDARECAAECAASLQRFQAIQESADIDATIDQADRLFGRGIYRTIDEQATCKNPTCNQPAAPGLGVCKFCNESGALDLYVKNCPHCGAPVTPAGLCEDDCIYSNVVELSRDLGDVAEDAITPAFDDEAWCDK